MPNQDQKRVVSTGPKKWSLWSNDPLEREWAVRASVQAQHRRAGDDPAVFASDDISLPPGPEQTKRKALLSQMKGK